MKKELLQKTISTVLFLFFVASMYSNVLVMPKRNVSKHRVESTSARPACKSKKMASLELRMLSRSSNLHKAADESVVEYADSTVIFTAQGEKTYITHFKYDDSHRVIHQTELSITTEKTWVKVNEKIVEYDQAGRPVYNEFYELKDNVWTGTQKGIVKYDEYGNEVYSESFYWNAQTSSWNNVQKEISEYRPDGKAKWEEMYYWQGDMWGLMDRETFEYNEQGLLVKSNEYGSGDEGIYQYAYTDYEYDAIKTSLLSTRTAYELDYDTGEFVAIERATFTYNDKDEEILTLWEEADEENPGEWVISQKVVHEYTDGNQTLELVYDWINGDWKLNQRWEGEYDAKNRETKSRFLFPDSEDKLILSSQYTHEYDANDNLILDQVETILTPGTELTVFHKSIFAFDDASHQILSEIYEYSGNALVGVSKEISVYTGYKDNIAKYEYYQWLNNGWYPCIQDVSTYENNILKEVIRSVGGTNSDEWVEASRFTFDYNENNSLIRENLYKKAGANLWEMDVYLLYYYPSATGLKTNKIVRPNISASNGVLTIFNLTGNELIRIYNINGQLIQSTKSQRDKFTTSLSQGIYVICIGNTRSKITVN